MISVTYGQLVQGSMILQTLMSKKLPPATRLLLMKNAQEINIHLKNYDDVRNNLLKEHCILTEDGSIKVKEDMEKQTREVEFISDEERIKFSKEIEPVLSTSIDLNLSLFSNDDFSDDFAADQLLAISWMIKEMREGS